MIGRQKKPSGHGKGKWHSTSSIRLYRRKRDAANKGQRAARKRNRAA